MVNDTKTTITIMDCFEPESSSTNNNRQQKNNKTNANETETDKFPPLDIKTLNYDKNTSSGSDVTNDAEFNNKSNLPELKYICFYLPHIDTLNDVKLIQDWSDLMEIYQDDLKWLLKLPYNKFWSIMTYTSEISSQVLDSFLNVAPRFYQSEFDIYQSHEVIGPLYKNIYALVFRIYMRLSIFKESKQEHLSPENWVQLLSKTNLVEIQKIMDLCALYEHSENSVLPKMIENLFRYIPFLEDNLKQFISDLIKKVVEFGVDIKSKLENNFIIDEWNLKEYEDLLNVIMNIVISLCKFLKIYPSACSHFQKYVNVVGMSYELNIHFWQQIVVQYLPILETQVHVLRIYFLRLVRQILATPTILSVKSSDDTRIDDYFSALITFLDMKLIILDYEKAFPFKRDMQTLLSRGIVIDETRIDYLSNAIASYFETHGETHTEERVVTDPLYDPNFDRQLLGACSLDVVGVELKSLITQVKDLLPDLPDAYVEVCLKHFGFNPETTINALLEGNVPEHLEKYRDEEYVKSQKNPTIQINNDPIKDDLPSSIFSQSEAPYEKGVPMTFLKNKKNREWQSREQEVFFEESKVLKERILQNLEADSLAKAKEMESLSLNPKPKGTNSVLPEIFPGDKSIPYIDESFLPSYNEALEYNDEYDDTYDEAGIGMTEPDNILFKPLNIKAAEIEESCKRDDDEFQESTNGGASTSKADKPSTSFDAFVEDPAIIRARYEQRRDTKYQNQHRNQAAQGNRDVVGKAKGQGQDKEVQLNRRHKDQVGSHQRRNRSDYKRKEF